jgi:acyl dehydratase
MDIVYWDDLEIGDELPAAEIFLAKDQVVAYARASGMLAARFMDDEKAREEGLPGIITPGNMTMGLLSRRLTEWTDGLVLTRLGVTFRGLILPEQTLRLQANVTGKDAADGVHTVEVDLWVETAAGERAVTGTATVALPRRP